MDALALVPSPHGAEGVMDIALAPSELEPVAEHNFNRKKLATLETGINQLQKTAREQHEVVSVLGETMKSVITETDLRRAIGLALQEFEARLEDTFTESNRKCLAMFSKRDDLAELQALISKKVNWAEYNAVLKKLAELRQYIDTMADSVFIGHINALNGEFAKKADASTVDEALKSKADFKEVGEVRARLERLEALMSQADAKHSNHLQELRTEMDRDRRTHADERQAQGAEHSSALGSLRNEQKRFMDSLAGAESQITGLCSQMKKLQEVQDLLQHQQQDIVMTSINSLQEQVKQVDSTARQAQADLQSISADIKVLQESSQSKFGELSGKVDSCKEQVDFLMQATEMIKRRAREQGKTEASHFKELSDGQANFTEQLAAVERCQKRLDRDLKAIDHRASKALSSGTLMALPAPPPQPPPDQNARLKGVLEKLEMIAGGDSGKALDGSRTQLPMPGAWTGVGAPMEASLAEVVVGQLPRLEQSELDGPGGRSSSLQNSARTVYGASPRGPPSPPRSGRRKKGAASA